MKSMRHPKNCKGTFLNEAMLGSLGRPQDVAADELAGFRGSLERAILGARAVGLQQLQAR